MDGTETRLGVGFAGTAPQTSGAISAVFAVTAPATYYVVRCVTDPDIPPSHGRYRPVSVEYPKRPIVNPESPTAVNGGSPGTMDNVTFGHRRDIATRDLTVF
ncbi:hydantoinase B/oxoprolinase family protein [Haloarcula salina]|uniref:Hydantoinase B/oxoprolinase family protein n=1 Tax=Haloarcula salina TaxID=1429914 RepID=A0AA41KHG7_9EURY|nr:hydantoinase B/oxoprolinase family protein [Haloarcula salina]MBV0901751.1 hydantoinase B/oxoprolinase family protein [Haloarcula salina]